jgi:hypothetical protein
MPERDDQLVEKLMPDFFHKQNPGASWMHACSMYMNLPGLRAFWPMSSVAYTNPQGVDLSGQGHHLTNNNLAQFGRDGLAPYCEFNGTTQYLSKVDGGAGNWADITGLETMISSTQRGLTLGGWFKFDSLDASAEMLISKWGASGQRSYQIRRPGGVATLRFSVTVNGVNITQINTTETVDAVKWWFITARFVPSTTLDLFINNEPATLAIGVPASVFDSTASFIIANDVTLATPFDGKTSMCFLCAAALPNDMISAMYRFTAPLFGVPV